MRLNQAYEHLAGFCSRARDLAHPRGHGEDGTPTPYSSSSPIRIFAPGEAMSEAGGPMSCALNLEMREVEKALRVANAAVIREEWLEAKGALAEVQERVGRLLLEAALKQTSVPIPIVAPPSDVVTR